MVDFYDRVGAEECQFLVRMDVPKYDVLSPSIRGTEEARAIVVAKNDLETLRGMVLRVTERGLVEVHFGSTSSTQRHYDLQSDAAARQGPAGGRTSKLRAVLCP